MWKLWRTWPGAQEIDQRNEIINWMAANLMHQTKKTDFNSVLLDKLNTNILECKKLVGYVDEDDSNDDDSNSVDDDRFGADDASFRPDDDGDAEEKNKRKHSDEEQHQLEIYFNYTIHPHLNRRYVITIVCSCLPDVQKNTRGAMKHVVWTCE